MNQRGIVRREVLGDHVLRLKNFPLFDEEIGASARPSFVG